MSGEVWYYTDSRQKTADRPHPVTIRLALLSPLLAIVATIISLISVYTSQQAVRIGQRAYVSVKDGSIWTSPQFINYKLTLHNLGNSPASSVFVKYLISRDDDNAQTVTNEPIQVDIGPKDSRAFEGQLPNEAEGHPVRLVGFVFFNDVFAKRHSIAWCWDLPVGKPMARCELPQGDWKIFGIPE
jgi:hypothetical protein